MTEYKQVEFFKYQGAGNDFILFEDFSGKLKGPTAHEILKLCDRNYGIGGDGVIILQSSIIATTKMRIFNADGGEADICGNGLRCTVAHFGHEKVSIETNAGICIGESRSTGIFVTLPCAEDIMSPLALENNQTAHLINMGVPHLIIMVESLEDIEFEHKARKLRNHKMFAPAGVNVSYITTSNDSIFIRTYERGVEGETLACGTASAAAAFVMRNYDKKRKSMYTVYPKSLNPLHFIFDNQGRIGMLGPASRVFQGQIHLSVESQIKRTLSTIRG